MVLFDNGKFLVSYEHDDVYLEVLTEGATIQDFQAVCSLHPRIKVTAFGVLRKSFDLIDGKRRKIGALKPVVELSIRADGMVATITVNLTEAQMIDQRKAVLSDILKLVEQEGIVYGVRTDTLRGDLPLGRPFPIAEGKEPIPGQDAKCRYFELTEKKPEISQDGSADHYELNLIDNIQKGEWLGDKIHVVEGIYGKNVHGADIPPKTGKDKTLRFDEKTVEALRDTQAGKTTLLAKVDGAVAFKSGRITVDNHLYINGDVDFETGNIRFDGNVTITGVVKDKFSVEATGDIAIKGENGIGAVDLIHSKNGSVYIRGGINGRNEATIRAKMDIFAKYCNEADLHAERAIHIGLYAFDSQLKADKVIVSPQKGKIIGGQVDAGHQIVAGSIGNAQERKTKIYVKGFERADVTDELKALRISFEGIIRKTNKTKRQLEIFETNFDALDDKAINTYRAMVIQYDNLIDDINRMNREVNRLEDVLRTRGEGEVKIQAGMYPKTMLEIKRLQKYVSELTTCSFYAKGRELLIAAE